MIRKVFSRFRHGRAERTLRHDPFILFSTFAPHLISDEGCQPVGPAALKVRWNEIPVEGDRAALEMCWTTEFEMRHCAR